MTREIELKNLKEWEESTNRLAATFIKKYFDGSAGFYWIGGHVGQVLEVNDNYFDLKYIKEALEFDATYDQLLEYSNLEATKKSKKDGKLASFELFVKHNLKWL